MKKHSARLYSLLGILLLTINTLCAQEYYFPEYQAEWKTASATSGAFTEASLQAAVDFAMEHEYTGSRDLRQAILKGFAGLKIDIDGTIQAKPVYEDLELYNIKYRGKIYELVNSKIKQVK